jgi:hypothetical protein
MSFRTILKDKTNEVINRIKTNAINEFIEWLKSYMIHIANSGKNKGNIKIQDIFFEEFDEILEVLLFYGTIDSDKKLYPWLLENSKKSGEFDDIYMYISGEDDEDDDEIREYYLHFHWDLE